MTVNGRLAVTFNGVGLTATVAWFGPVSMTVGAARKKISEGLLARVLAEGDMGKIEPHCQPRAHSSTCLLQEPS